MPTDLTGVHAKLERAELQCIAIDTAAREYTEVKLPNAVRETLARHPLDLLDEDWQVLRWDGVPLLSRTWGVILGEFVHNVRSALDQLIWALVTANNGDPGVHTQFPASESEAKWRDDVTERNTIDRGLPPTAGLSEEALALIYEFQPFNQRPGKGKAVTAPFYKLLRLSNEDKHRTLHAVAAYSASVPTKLRIAPSGYVRVVQVRRPPPGAVIEDGAEIASVRLAMIAPPPEDVKMKVRFSVKANVGFIAGAWLIASLDELEPMLSAAREVVRRASLLPEISA